MSGDERSEAVAAGLARVEERIDGACRAAGRSRDEVTLVVVTKYFPASDVRILAGLGVRHVGENRYQEAVAKREECADLAPAGGSTSDLTWHFLGRLQSNKAAAVGRWADVVQSLDRPKLVAGLARGAHEVGVRRDVLVQVNLDPDPAAAAGRGGAAPADVEALAHAVAAEPSLRLRGVMGVAPLGTDPRPAFEALRAAGERVAGVVADATWISAGMSGDLEDAVACGATHVRVGGAILGDRPTNG